jgi:phosphopantetheine adenylyltransferase
LLDAAEELVDVSSTLVRTLIGEEKKIEKYMPSAAAELAKKIIKNT